MNLPCLPRSRFLFLPPSHIPVTNRLRSCDRWLLFDNTEVGMYCKAMSKIYSVTEAADKAGCTVSYVRRLLRDGTLRGEKLGAWSWILKKSEVDKLSKTLGFRGKTKIIRKKV